MIVLGVDPGNVRLGYGLIEKKGSFMRYIGSGLLKIPGGKDAGKQLLAIEDGLSRVVKKFKPERIGVEKIFFSKNKKTGIFVAQARGLILKVAAENDLELIELTPSSIKLSVTGNGRSDKAAVARMVGLFLKIGTAGMIDDESDALATAIAASDRIIGR